MQFPERDELNQLVHDILGEAKSQGAAHAEAGVSISAGLSTTVRMGEVETIEHNRDKGLAVTVYLEGKDGMHKGNASTSDLSASAIRETVKAACNIARFTSPDQCAGLAPDNLMASNIPDLDLYHPWNISPEQSIELARECEQAALEMDARIDNSDGATLSSHEGYRAYGNSHGFLGAYPSTRHGLSCVVIAKDGESMERDYWYSSTRDAQEMENPIKTGRKAGERTLKRLNAQHLTTRQCPVIYSADIASSLLGHFIGGIRGGALYRKSTFLLDSLGEPVFPEFIQLEEQPHLVKAMGSAPFDSDGVVTQRHHIVRDGRVESYVLDAYSACQLGMQTTGNAGGVHNLTIQPGQDDLAGLVKQMNTGLLITELMGQGINMVTGDYSRGAASFWVENGEIQYPVHELTVAGNLKEMFKQIVAVGNDVDLRGNTRTGSILLENMAIAGD
ncbi:MAG: metalloprotease PmbA [Gammaproteobacteria bacterium]|nr:metalloprotease PmbA [Gammaproteobacteria bacterium]